MGCQMVTLSHAAVLQQAAQMAAGAQHYPTSALYVVATPIGNLADITLRAIHVLVRVDAVACEDTRHTAPMLRQWGIEGKPLIAVHEHNEREAALAVLQRLQRGERVAYVSDAGTPAISDPGAALVAAVQSAGLRTVPIPGASSVVAALSVAGDAGGSEFVFRGFVPARGGERAQALKHWAQCLQSQVFFEAPHRIESLALALAQACPMRRLTVGRELTKQFETVHTLAAQDLAGWLAGDGNRGRGEFVLVLHAHGDPALLDSAGAHDATLRALMAVLSLKQAVTVAAELTGAGRNELYERALTLRQDLAGE